MEQHQIDSPSKIRLIEGNKKGGEVIKNKWKIIIDKYNENPKHCIICNHPLSYYKRKSRFCGSSCSAIYNNKHRKYNPSKDNRKKVIKCAKCNQEIKVNLRASKKTLCKNCKKDRRKQICKICGQLIHPRPDICRKHQLFFRLIKYHGFDKSKIGTIGVYEEFDRIRNKLIEEYWDKHISVPQLMKQYGYYNNVRNFSMVFNYLNIQQRNLGQAVSNSYLNGRKVTGCPYPYKRGWHTTWDNKQVFYRSSYELKYAEELDEQKIEYEMEKLRILYWDTQLLKQRVAIPDFYLPKKNKIVEMKSPWTLDEQNMKDKEKAYKEHGYDFELIVK